MKKYTPAILAAVVIGVGAVAAPTTIGQVLRLHQQDISTAPAASALNEGGLLYDTDAGVLYVSNGVDWGEAAAKSRTYTSTVPSGQVGLSFTNAGACIQLSPSLFLRRTAADTTLGFASTCAGSNGATIDASSGTFIAGGEFTSTRATGTNAFTCSNVGCRLSLGSTARYLNDDGAGLAYVGGTTFTAPSFTTPGSAGTVYAAVMSGGTPTLKGTTADGAGAVATKLHSSTTYSTAGAKLLSIQNNAAEVASVDKDGRLSLAPDAGIAVQMQRGARINLDPGFGHEISSDGTWTILHSSAKFAGEVAYATGARGYESATKFKSFTAAGTNAFECANVGCRITAGNTARYVYDTGTELAVQGPLVVVGGAVVQGGSFYSASTSFFRAGMGNDTANQPMTVSDGEGLALVGVATGALPACNNSAPPTGTRGAIQYDTTLSRYAYCNGTSWVYLVAGGQTLVDEATHDFGSLSTGNCADTTLAVTGAAAGDACSVGAAAYTTDAQFSCQGTDVDVVTIRHCCNGAGPCDPPSQTYKVRVFK